MPRRARHYIANQPYHIDSDDLHKLRKSIHYCQPLGDEYFAQLINEKYGIKVG